MVDSGTPDRLENVQEEVPGRGARNAGGCTYIQYVLREECWSDTLHSSRLVFLLFLRA